MTNRWLYVLAAIGFVLFCILLYQFTNVAPFNTRTKESDATQPVKLTVQDVYMAILGGDEGKKKFVEMQESSLPVIYQMLETNDVNVQDVKPTLFWIVERTTGDRSKFRKFAVRDISVSNFGLRLCCLRLLSAIGTPEDLPSVYVLLASDYDSEVYEAFSTISKIGSERDIMALEIYHLEFGSKKKKELFELFEARLKEMRERLKVDLKNGQ